MPAVATTNRAAGTGTGTDDYLRDQPPTTTAAAAAADWSLAQSGLSVLVAVVVLRLCIRRFLRNRRTRSQRHQAPSSTRHHVRTYSHSHLHHLGHHHHHHQSHAPLAPPPPRIMDEKDSDQRPLVSGPSRPHPAAPDAFLRRLMARPPPAPPLTPPELSATVFSLEDSPHSRDSLIHQPNNPDYLSGSGPTATAADAASEAGAGAIVRQPHHGTMPSPPQPRRLSYQRTMPIGLPITRQSSASESDAYFSPSSYPPSSPLLPPPPPTDFAAGVPLDAEDPAAAAALARRDIEMRGEIVGVLNGHGVGWTRHTRVYGGGPCMACAAAGRAHGDGGFYGPNVMPEEMRY